MQYSSRAITFFVLKNRDFVAVFVRLMYLGQCRGVFLLFHQQAFNGQTVKLESAHVLLAAKLRVLRQGVNRPVKFSMQIFEPILAHRNI